MSYVSLPDPVVLRTSSSPPTCAPQEKMMLSVGFGSVCSSTFALCKSWKEVKTKLGSRAFHDARSLKISASSLWNFTVSECTQGFWSLPLTTKPKHVPKPSISARRFSRNVSFLKMGTKASQSASQLRLRAPCSWSE